VREVDWSQRRDARFEFGDPSFESDAVGQFGLDHLAEFSRLDAEVVADQFIQVGDLDDQLGLLDLTSTNALAQLRELRLGVFSLASNLFQAFGPARVASNCSR